MALGHSRTAFGLPNSNVKTKTHRRGLFIDGQEWRATARSKRWYGTHAGFNWMLTRPSDNKEFKGFLNYLVSEEVFKRLIELIQQGQFG